MKTFIHKISLIAFLITSAFLLNAQTISVSATLGRYTQVIANGTTFNTTLVSNLNTYLSGTVTVSNTSSTTALVLTLNGSSYLTLSGTNPSDFTVTPQGGTFNGTIPANSSQVFNVSLGSGATNGSNKTLTITINSNDPSSPYTGSITYSFSGLTTPTVNASDIGLSIYPNPSVNGGTFYVKSPSVNVNRIVVSNSAGVSEEYTSTYSFTTKLKGLLLVQLYTDNGLVYDKLIVQ